MSAHLNVKFHEQVIRMGRHSLWYYPNVDIYMYVERGNPKREFIKPSDLRKWMAKMDEKSGVYGAFTKWMKRCLRDSAAARHRYVANTLLARRPMSYGNHLTQAA